MHPIKTLTRLFATLLTLLALDLQAAEGLKVHMLLVTRTMRYMPAILKAPYSGRPRATSRAASWASTTSWKRFPPPAVPWPATASAP